MMKGNVIDITKDILYEYYVRHNPEIFIKYMSKDICNIGITTDKDIFGYEDICQYLNYSCFLYGDVKIENDDYRIVKESGKIIIVEASFDIVSQYETKHFHMTIVYELDDSVKIVYMHNSKPYNNISKASNIKDNVRDLFETSSVPGVCCYVDDHYTYSYINDAFCLLLGYSREEFLEIHQNKAINTIYQPDRNNVRKKIKEHLNVGNIYHVEYRIQKKDNSLIWVMEQGQSFTDEYGNVMVYAYISDITSLKTSEMNQKIQKEKYSLALKDNSITIMEYDIKLDRMIIDIQIESKKKIYENYLDYIRSSRTTVFEEDKEKVCDLFLRKIKGPIEIREHVRGEEQYVRKSMDSRVIYDENNEPVIVLATVRDITTEYNHNAIMKKRIQTDHLTHLLNFESGRKKVEKYLNKKGNDSCALLVLDIDYFKAVNDNYGHLFGNDVLVTFADCLSSIIDHRHLIIRIGGDEFMILLKDVSREEAKIISDDVICEVRKLEFKEHDLTITTSIGVCYLDSKEYSYDFELLFKNADALLYKAKRNGRNRYEFSDDLNNYLEENDSYFMSYDELYHHVEELLSKHASLSEIMGTIGQYYRFQRISLMKVNSQTKKYFYKNLWISSRTYQNKDHEGILNDCDFENVFKKENIFHLNEKEFSESFVNLLKQGVSKSIIVSMIDGGFITFVNYTQYKNLTEEEYIQIQKLISLITLTCKL